MWIPGHVGSQGDELAERAAKALELPLSTGKVPPSDIIRAACRTCKLILAWTGVWNNKFMVVKDSHNYPWGTDFGMSRMAEVVLCRLCIGHTHLTHGFPHRSDDRVLPVTRISLLKHILVSCYWYSKIQRCFCRLTSLSNILANDETSVNGFFEFLTRCSLRAFRSLFYTLIKS